METRTVSDALAFSEEKMKKNALFDSPHLFYDAYCLLPGQSQKSPRPRGLGQGLLRPARHGSLSPWARRSGISAQGNAVIARAGDPHGVRNETQEDLVILVTMAPRPS